MVIRAVADTDVLVDLLRWYPTAVAWREAQEFMPAVCGLSAYVLYEGCRNRIEVLKVSQLPSTITEVWPSPDACSEALTQFPARFLRQRLGVKDSLISASDRELSVPLYTFNTKHFRSVECRVIEQPYAR
jgi:predicted nucleic acid-binding protein